MQKTKLVTLLRQLSETQLGQLKKYLQSPYFNTNQSIEKLYDFLIQFAPSYQAESMSKPAAYAYVYPNESFNDRGLNVLRSRLLRLVKDFLVQEAIEQDEFAQNLALLRFYNEQNMPEAFERELKSIRKGQGKVLKDAEFFAHSYWLSREQHRFDSTWRGKFDELPVIEALDRWYLMMKSVYLCNHANNNRILGEDMDLTYTPNINFAAADSHNFNAWNAALEFLKTPDSELHYFALKQQLFEHAASFSANDLRNLTLSLQNNAPKIFESDLQRSIELFQIYELLAQQGVLDSINLSASLARNISSVAIKLRRLDWLKHLFTTHQAHIKDFQDGLYEITLARIHFEEGKFDMASELLQTIEWTDEDSDIKIGDIDKAFIYRLKIKIAYETEQSVEYIIKAFRTFLSRLKTRLNVRHLYLLPPFRLFNNICAEFLKFNPLASAEEQLKAIQKIEAKLFPEEEAVQIIEKEWFLMKLEALLPNEHGKQLLEGRALLKKSYTKENKKNTGIAIRAFEANLKQWTLTDRQRVANEQFAILLNALRMNTKATKELRQTLYHTKNLVERAWLLEQVSNDGVV